MVEKRDLEDYITFYHEVGIPQNPFFDVDSNLRPEEGLLVVSSPSRMGNHLIMSMLDGHPQLPKLPGQDGFLAFSFTESNLDLHRFLESLRGPGCFEFVTRLGTQGVINKWKAFKQSYLSGERDLTYAGVQKQGEAPILDYEGMVFDINYDHYEDFLRENLASLQKTERYSDVLQVYLNALQLLDPEPFETQYPLYIAFSGMRTQVMWVCQTHHKSKVLCSLRSFDSYVISHINSRPEHTGISPEGIQEAWEHWYHKVIDAIYLKRKFPNNIGLLTYEDMIYKSLETQQSICDFLEIEHSSMMGQQTIFGNPVRGNSWISRLERPDGIVYDPAILLDESFIPDDCRFIWDNLNQLTLNHEYSQRARDS